MQDNNEILITTAMSTDALEYRCQMAIDNSLVEDRVVRVRTDCRAEVLAELVGTVGSCELEARDGEQYLDVWGEDEWGEDWRLHIYPLYAVGEREHG